MSHEIRTPLNAIVGMTYLLLQTCADASQRDQLTKVDGAAKHLRGLIDDILDLSKIEAGKLVLDRSTFRMADVMARATGMVRDAAAAKGLALKADIALPEHFRGDALRLSQILINLLSNAVKFTAEGSVALRAGVIENTPDRVCTRFEVEDTGPGIDPDIQSRLFVAFEQAETSTNRLHGGTGLGLALTRQLARAMGGDAGVKSVPGVGSTFWFTAWFDKPAADSCEAVERAGVASAASAVDRQRSDALALLKARHGGSRVLLAEDNVINRQVGVGLLRAVEMSVVTAKDGKEAIDRALSESFDLILMDMQMPVVDGIEATKVLRAGMVSVPIIAMTANAFVEDRAACLAAGMDDHIAKPVDPQLLYAILLRWLPSQGGDSASAMRRGHEAMRP